MAKIITVKEAVELVQDGAVIGSAVQGMTGWPEEIGLAIENRFMETGHPSGITHIHGAGQGDFGRMSEDGKTCRGECALAHDGLLSCSIHGHVGCSFKVTKQIVDNKILAYNIPLAWAVSVYFVKFPDQVMEYLKQSSLDDWTYNKALQKITESFRVDKETKKLVRQMRRGR